MPEFIKGLELSGILYREAVAPILEKEFPGLRHSAGLLNYGSDLLGFDSERSMDHGWGPRVMLFLRPEDIGVNKDRIFRVMAEKLPVEIRGFPTHMGRHDDGTIFMQAIEKGPVNHQVSVTTVQEYAGGRLGLGWPIKLSTRDWLAIPQQRLAALQSGGVYFDGLGELEPMRRTLAWYPHELWLHLMACQWDQIAQEEPFVGRCGHAGDELGSQIVAARLVKELMQLCFLMEKRYRPYSKWLGSAFARLNCAMEMKMHLEGVLACDGWKERETQLSLAYGQVAQMHNALGLTEALSTEVTPFYHRPYQVIKGGRFADALRAGIKDTGIKGLPKGLGSIDQITDNVDILENLDRSKKMIP